MRIHASKKPEKEEQIDLFDEAVEYEETPEPVIETDENEIKPFSEPRPTEIEPIEHSIRLSRHRPEKTYIQETPLRKEGNANVIEVLDNLLERITNMALNLELLREEVTRAKTVQTSAVELIKKVVGELEAVSAELAARESEPPIDTSAIDTLAADLKASTDVLAAAVADSVDVKPVHSVVLNADNPEKATVEVVLPEVLPEVVEATVEPVTEAVDPTSPDPQVRVVVDEASEAVVDAVSASSPEVVADPAVNIPTLDGEISTGVVETDEGESNVTVAVDPATPVTEVVEAVKEAYDATEEVTAVPETPVQ